VIGDALVSDTRTGASSAVDQEAPQPSTVLSKCCGRPMTRRVDAEGAGEFFCCSACDVGFYFHF
jgi:hypothetical protein